MASCPYCAEQIVPKAKVCPSCGMELKSGTAGGPSRGRPAPKSGGMSGSTVALIVVGCVAGVFLLCGGVIAAFMIPAVGQARNAARTAQSKNNLKQLGLAFHIYHDMHRLLPIGGTYTPDGAALHSWQTRLLPYCDQAPLFDRVNFQASWDDPSNTASMVSMVPTFLNPNMAGSPTDARGYALSHYAGNVHVLPRNSSMGFRDVIDGLSNTILAGEVSSDFKPWGDPSNLRDPAAGINAGPNTFGAPPGPRGPTMLMMDGSVREINPSINPATLRALSTPSGSEPVNEF